jgi:hypothetical protein
MRPVLAAALMATTLGLTAAADAAVRPGLHRLVAERLAAEKPQRPAPTLVAPTTGTPLTHATDFAGDNIGCITLSRREMRRFGYPGHAFVCEEAAQGEVLGAVLDRWGARRCLISGDYTGNDCYTLTICDVPETLCVR